MILYKKTPQLRIKRASSPAPPYWFATAIAPYGARRASPVAIDYLDLRASATERLEVTVCENVRDELERRGPLAEPVLIEAAEFSEVVFGRGEEALASYPDALFLTSTRGALPSLSVAPPTSAAIPPHIIISAWPFELERLEPLFAEAASRRWGVAIPIIYPVTTDLTALAQLAELAKKHGAAFLAPISVTLDPTAKQTLARSLTLDGDDEVYAMLFHADLEPVHIATERHIAALAAEIGVADFIVPPRWPARSNWNAAILLTLTATRMLAMEHEPSLAGDLARSARVVAELDKPIERIAAAASLSIVGALDEVSVDILTEWLESGKASFVEKVNRMWRLRRDYTGA